MYITTAVVNDCALPTLEAGSPPVAGAILHLSAEDPSNFTITNGAVSQWSDQSGNNNHATQATASARGFLVCNESLFRGQALLGLHGTPQHYSVTGVTASDRTQTYFIVGLVTSFDVMNTIIGTTADSGRQTRIETNGRITTTVSGITNIFSSSASMAVSVGSPFVIGVILDTNTCEHRLNRFTPESTSNSNSFTAGRTTEIGWKGTSGDPQPLVGLTAEILVYDSVFSSGDASSTMTYLLNKWAI